MVEIEAVADDNSPESPTLEENAEGKETTADGWQKLMGEDLMMKVIDSNPPPALIGNDPDDPEAVKPHDAVLINFVGRIADDKSITDGLVFQDVKSWLVVIGEGDVLPALEMAVRFMETGQTARVWSHSKFAFGPGTRLCQNNTKVPPNSNVLYEVTVTRIVIDTSRLNPYFTIQKALTRKNIANDIYQCEWCAPPKTPNDPDCESAMARAIRLYQKAAKDMETLLQGTYFQQVEEAHPQRHQSRQLLLDALNNTVAVYLKQQQYHKAKHAAVEVLKQDPKNIKALLRAGKAALLDPASTMEEVKASLQAADSEITYKNPQEEKELKRLKAEFKRKQHEYKQKTKEMFADKLKTNTLSDEPAGSEVEMTTKDIPTTSKAEEETTENEKEDMQTRDDLKSFWKTQIFTIFLQVGIPLVLFVFYRLLIKTNIVARETMAAGGGVPIVEEEDHDIIDLDL